MAHERGCEADLATLLAADLAAGQSANSGSKRPSTGSIVSIY
jgi:hypothetical protein